MTGRKYFSTKHFGGEFCNDTVTVQRLYVMASITRRYIGESLRKYFSRDVINTSSIPIEFSSFTSEGDYRRAVSSLYSEKPRSNSFMVNC
jgi:hypothetical protein